ncbi:two-component system response regulator [Pacificimonas flava]|uniref:Two-component system response regulator n=2 Tax=Pacificimonas TaxID=1960290 RepID=A0A219B1V5_9SPHN|nr:MULTISPECIES: response regulator transcription factor [Pacificimonas]MBZ6378013.1 response regulator transcription factor [Pacificimonas aurantium]OWV32342.1 two-component system response regulator [Pacificimonas flava]
MAEDPTDLDDRLRGMFLGRTALVLEDEPELAGHLASVLSRHGFADVDVVADGEEAVARAGAQPFDILVLDRQVPGLNGLAALERIRASGASSGSPALFLTALGTERQRVEGIASGGDDYVVKPVGDLELLARLAALLRRQVQEPERGTRTVQNGPLMVDPATLTARLGEEALDLTPREHGILLVLAENSGLPVTRSMLWSRCWSDYNFMPANATNTIDVHVSRLRKKLDAASEPIPESLKPLIVAVRGRGLMLRDLGAI